MNATTRGTAPLGAGRSARLVGAALLVLGVLQLTTGRSGAVQFCNTAPIIGTTLPGPSNVYPSPINVSGLSGTITDVNVSLVDFRTRGDNNVPPQHWAEDMDVLVSAPDNSNVILMSDAGGNNDVSSGPVLDADLTFDDQATNQVPANSLITSGTFRPVNDDDPFEGAPDQPDEWPSPAPTPSGSTSLATFNGIDPNGTWNLWVVDDTFQAPSDFQGGWCVDILTSGGTTTTSSTVPTSPTTTSSTVPTSPTTTSSTVPTSPTTTSSTVPTSPTTTSTTPAPGALDCDTLTSTTLAPSDDAPTAAVSPGSVQAGGEVSVTGGGFMPGEPLDLGLCSAPVSLGTVTADPSGDYRATVTVPTGTAAGAHTVVVASRDRSRIATAGLTVVASDGGGGGGGPTVGTTGRGALSRTGSDNDLKLAWAAMLLTLGGLFCMGAKVLPGRRHH